MTMHIEQASPADLPAVLKIFARARAFMKENGNPNQWKDNRPDISLITGDLKTGRMFVSRDEKGIHGVFSLLPGEDPTYLEIEKGDWLNQEPYAAIHRVASDGTVSGFFGQLLTFCCQKAREAGIENLRMDTHEQNLIMRHLLEKNGFIQCGIIHTDDGTPRLAFQKLLSPALEADQAQAESRPLPKNQRLKKVPGVGRSAPSGRPESCSFLLF